MIKYKQGYKYQLYETFATKIAIYGFFIKTDFILLDKLGNLVILKGYAWDGPTGIPDVKELMEPSLIHDALYQLIRMNLLPENMKKKADKEFIKAAEQKGVSEDFQDILGKGVEVLGFLGLGEERKVFTA